MNDGYSSLSCSRRTRIKCGDAGVILKLIDLKIFNIMYGLLLAVAVMVAVIVFLKVIPIRTLEIENPLPVDKTTVYPGEIITARVHGMKYTNVPGIVTWRLDGFDVNNKKRSYVLLVVPPGAQPGPIDDHVGLIVWPEAVPGKYRIDHYVLYNMFGGIRHETLHHWSNTITILPRGKEK